MLWIYIKNDKLKNKKMLRLFKHNNYNGYNVENRHNMHCYLYVITNLFAT